MKRGLRGLELCSLPLLDGASDGTAVVQLWKVRELVDRHVDRRFRCAIYEFLSFKAPRNLNDTIMIL